MPYEDPIEAALRSLTDTEWRKRKDGFETRVNKTHMVGITEMLADHHITVEAEVSEARSGRYIMKIGIDQMPAIEKALKATGAVVKPHRRKWQS